MALPNAHEMNRLRSEPVRLPLRVPIHEDKPAEAAHLIALLIVRGSEGEREAITTVKEKDCGA